MSVQQGLYLLMVGDNHIPIGRYYIEDRSLLPKRVLSLPQGSQPPQVRLFAVSEHSWESADVKQWVILKNDSGKYVLKADGAPVFIKNNLIYADLLGDQATQKWDITPAGADGRYK